MRLFLYNKFVPTRDARISVLDRGFLYGDGVFETLRAYNGQPFQLENHLVRLSASAREIRIPLPFPLQKLRQLLLRALSVNRLQEAILRISISRGQGPIGLVPRPDPKPTLVIIPRSFNGYPPARYRKGLKVAIVSVRRIPPQALDPGIKSSNFLNNILAGMEAQRRRADEGLMLTLTGHLAEGTISNLFLVKQGRLFTPRVGLGILPGITRRLVIHLAKQLRIPVKECRLVPADLYKADECFLTNSSMEVMPVFSADGHRIGNGKPGITTRRLHEAYREKVRLECGP